MVDSLFLTCSSPPAGQLSLDGLLNTSYQELTFQVENSSGSYFVSVVLQLLILILLLLFHKP